MKVSYNVKFIAQRIGLKLQKLNFANIVMAETTKIGYPLILKYN